MSPARHDGQMDAETRQLQKVLDSQRRHVLNILDGLSEEQLRQPVLPSGWSCLGMLQHLSLADEHYWFSAIMGGDSLDFFPEGENADWHVATDHSVEDVLDLYRNEIASSDAVIARCTLSTAPQQPDPQWEEWGMSFPDLRTILLHVITETACHAGHLDAVRELLDGRQYIVL